MILRRKMKSYVLKYNYWTKFSDLTLRLQNNQYFVNDFGTTVERQAGDSVRTFQSQTTSVSRFYM